jgi:hypothetical protein
MDQRYPYQNPYPNVFQLRPHQPAGQVASPVSSPPAPPTSPPVTIGPDGRIVGIEGILDQIAQAAARQAGPLIQQAVPPILRDTVLPILSRDKEMQRTVGAAAGQAAVKEIKPWVILLSVSLGVIAGIQVAKFVRSRGRT